MFDDILKNPNVQGYCENCRNGHFVGVNSRRVMCQIKGYTVDRKHTCKLWAAKGYRGTKKSK